MTACVGENVEYGEYLSTAGRSADLYRYFGNQYVSFSENWESIYLKTQQYHFWEYTQRMLKHITRTLAPLCSWQHYL